MTVYIYNVAITPNTEASKAMPSNTKRILIKTRTGADDLKIAYTATESGTEYITIPAGATKVFEETPNQSLSDLVLYFQSPTADTVEIEVWV
jgi:hypothetical protein